MSDYEVVSLDRVPESALPAHVDEYFVDSDPTPAFGLIRSHEAYRVVEVRLGSQSHSRLVRVIRSGAPRK